MIVMCNKKKVAVQWEHVDCPTHTVNHIFTKKKNVAGAHVQICCASRNVWLIYKSVQTTIEIHLIYDAISVLLKYKHSDANKHWHC